MTDSINISVVLPGYNEADNIDAMLHKVQDAIAPLNRAFEIIYVDDGSTDSSREKLTVAQQKIASLRVIFHRGNHGQSAAVLTGYNAARGDLVITMDSDLQNDPADLPAMIDMLERNGVDAVCGIRQKRQDSRMKLFSSRIANNVRGWALHDGIHDAGCSMRVVRRAALNQLPAFRALHRFLPTILKIHGYKVAEIPIRHHARQAGVSKYGVGNRLWVGISDIFGIRWYRKRFVPPDRCELPTPTDSTP
ncbi:MAG: glycosyltransferase family 2 protein [Candidatus Sumerlaeaceae bacterium]